MSPRSPSRRGRSRSIAVALVAAAVGASCAGPPLRTSGLAGSPDGTSEPVGVSSRDTNSLGGAACDPGQPRARSGDLLLLAGRPGAMNLERVDENRVSQTDPAAPCGCRLALDEPRWAHPRDDAGRSGVPGRSSDRRRSSAMATAPHRRARLTRTRRPARLRLVVAGRTRGGVHRRGLRDRWLVRSDRRADPGPHAEWCVGRCAALKREPGTTHRPDPEISGRSATRLVRRPCRPARPNTVRPGRVVRGRPRRRVVRRPVAAWSSRGGRSDRPGRVDRRTVDRGRRLTPGGRVGCRRAGRDPSRPGHGWSAVRPGPRSSTSPRNRMGRDRSPGWPWRPTATDSPWFGRATTEDRSR